MAGSNVVWGQSSDKSTLEERLKRMYPWVNQQETPIPCGWSNKDKHNFINLVGPGNLRLQYKGPGKSQKDAAAVRATHAIPVSCGLFYFEIRVISKGREGYIGVGLCSEEVNLNRLPGWDKGSYGYHGDDGHSFWSSGTGRPYGPQFTTGDIIGCGLDLVREVCFYTKNGQLLGEAFNKLPANLYPCVGLQSIGEQVETNFGQFDFVYDLDSMRRELRRESREIISRMQPSMTRGEWEQMMQRVVSDYLVHNGYYAAADSFARSTGIEIKEQMTSMSNRQAIQKLILQGKISEAIALTHDLYPGVLDKNPGLLFRLKVRQFIEMVCGHDQGVTGDGSMSGLAVKPFQRHSRSRSRTPSPSSGSGSGSGSGSNQTQTQSGRRNKHGQNHATGLLLHQSTNAAHSSDNNAMEAETGTGEAATLDGHDDMDVDCQSSHANGEKEYHMNGNSENGDSTGCNANQTMDFEEEDEENRAPVSFSLPLVNRILVFGRQLQELSQRMRLDQCREWDNQKLMLEAFSFMAYDDPCKSPNRHLLDPVQREPVCAALNSAILGADRQSSLPALKIVVAHCKRLFPLLAKKGSGAIAFSNVFELLQGLSVSVDAPAPAPLPALPASRSTNSDARLSRSLTD